MKKILILLGIVLSFNLSAQKPSTIINRGDTIEVTNDTTWFYSFDFNLNEIKMVRLDAIYSKSAASNQQLGVSGNNITLTDGGTADVSSTTAVTTNSAKVTNATHSGEVTGATALTIADDVIEAVNLESTNSATDNYLPSYDQASGGFTWVASAGGGDLQSVNNLDDVADSVVALQNLNGVSAANPIIATDTLVFMSDTLVLSASIGVGNDGDTLGFALNNVIWGMRWDGTHTMNIKEFGAVVHGTTPDVDLALLTDVNFRDGTPTAILSADLTVTSTTTGNSTTSFADAIINPGDWIWLRIDQATAFPTQLIFYILYNKSK